MITLSTSNVEIDISSPEEAAALYRVGSKVERDAYQLPDPVEYIENRVGARLWGDDEKGQVAIARALVKHKKVVAFSASNVGKTHVAAHLIPWWMSRPDSLVLTTSATFSQLKEQLWYEFHIAHSRGNLEGRPLEMAWKLPDRRRAIARSTNKKGYFTGFHERHPLVIVDEGHGVPSWLYDTIEVAIADDPEARILVLGNPIEAAGPYYHLSTKKDWHQVYLSQWDYVDWLDEGNAPVPAMFDRGEPARKRDELGEHDPYYVTYTLGRFPEPGAAVTLFAAWKISDAFDRDADATGPVEVGLDIARLGGDRTVGFWRQGNKVGKLIDLGPKETAKLGKATREQYLAWLVGHISDKLSSGLPSKPSVVRVDCDGPGDGVADMLAAEGWPVARIHFGSKPTSESKARRYFNVRGFGYWELSKALDTGEVSLPEEKALLEELPAIRPVYEKATRDGKTRMIRGVTRKDDIVEEIGHSPDYADALMLTFLPQGSQRKASMVTHQRDPELDAHLRELGL